MLKDKTTSSPQKNPQYFVSTQLFLFFLFYFPFGILLQVDKGEDSKLIFFFVTVNIFQILFTETLFYYWNSKFTFGHVVK